MKISLFDKTINGGISPLECDTQKECGLIIDAWLSSKNFDKSVFVCFLNWTNEVDNFRDEQVGFFVSHSEDDISLYFHNQLNFSNWNDLHFIVLEFPSYKDAFGYCIDLKEGF